jgi:hypothetical protein
MQAEGIHVCGGKPVYLLLPRHGGEVCFAHIAMSVPLPVNANPPPRRAGRGAVLLAHPPSFPEHPSVSGEQRVYLARLRHVGEYVYRRADALFRHVGFRAYEQGA